GAERVDQGIDGARAGLEHRSRVDRGPLEPHRLKLAHAGGDAVVLCVEPLAVGVLGRRRHHALETDRRGIAAGRDPATIGLQSMVATPPKDADGKRFYAEHDRVAARVSELQTMGFQWAAINATAMFQAGARSVDALIDALGALHTKLRAEVG